MDIKAVNFNTEDIGKHIKSSKRRYTWLIKVNESEYKIDLLHSKLTLRFEIKINDKRHIKKQSIYDFEYSFNLKNYNILIKKADDGFELLINGQSFSNILMGHTVDSNSTSKNSVKFNETNNSNPNCRNQSMDFHNRNKSYNKRFTDTKIPKYNKKNLNPYGGQKINYLQNDTTNNNTNFSGNTSNNPFKTKINFGIPNLESNQNYPNYFNEQNNNPPKPDLLNDSNDSDKLNIKLKFLPTTD